MPSYPGFEIQVEAQREKPEIIAEASVPETLDHLSEVVERLDRPPIIMGHSFGGTFTQFLVNRGLGAAVVPEKNRERRSRRWGQAINAAHGRRPSPVQGTCSNPALRAEGEGFEHSNDVNRRKGLRDRPSPTRDGLCAAFLDGRTR